MLTTFPYRWAYVHEQYTTDLETLERREHDNGAWLATLHGWSTRTPSDYGYAAYPFVRVVTLPFGECAIACSDAAHAASEASQFRAELGVNTTEPHATAEHIFLHPAELVRVLAFLAMPRVLLSWQRASVRRELEGLPGVLYCGGAS